jgi:hypothetical protein
MQSVTESSYTGTVIVCTSAIAVLYWGLGFGNICVYMALGELLEREFCVLRRYIFHLVHFTAGRFSEICEVLFGLN